MIVVAVQLAPLLAIGAWQSGVTLLEADLLLAIVLVLAHLAWGNVVSVYEPRRMEPHRFASAGDLLTTSVSVLIGSAPGVAVFVVLRSDSGVAPVAIAVIVLVMAAAYVASLRYAGRIFDRRFEIIRERLA
jgi:FlaA1/EpsC-like NDP-sugar epimerase